MIFHQVFRGIFYNVQHDMFFFQFFNFKKKITVFFIKKYVGKKIKNYILIKLIKLNFLKLR